MKKVVLVCATPLSAADFGQKSKLGNFIKKYNIDFKVIFNNKTGLSKIYNCFITEEYRNSIVVFVHDDVSIEDAFLVEKLNKAVNKGNHIIGLAGGKSIQLKSPAMWHIMCDRLTWSGTVTHPTPQGDFYTNGYGPTPQRCVVIDGLFIAVDVESLLNKNVKFDEQFDFHFYDLDFCLNANQNQLKITTWPIWVVHEGTGASARSPEWYLGEKKFLDKWQNL